MSKTLGWASLAKLMKMLHICEMQIIEECKINALRSEMQLPYRIITYRKIPPRRRFAFSLILPDRPNPRSGQLNCSGGLKRMSYGKSYAGPLCAEAWGRKAHGPMGPRVHGPELSRQKPLGLTPATGQIEACQNHANTCQCNFFGGHPLWGQ